MSHYLIEQIAGIPKIEVRTGRRPWRRRGTAGSAVCVWMGRAERRNCRPTRASCSSAHGRDRWLRDVVARDERGFILAGLDAKDAGWPLPRDPYLLETTVPGVFVAGDVRSRSIKRVASAVGEGSMAVSLVHQYLVDGMTHRTGTDLRPIDLFDELDDDEPALGRRRAGARRRAGRRRRREGLHLPGLQLLLEGAARTLVGHGATEEPVTARRRRRGWVRSRR